MGGEVGVSRRGRRWRCSIEVSSAGVKDGAAACTAVPRAAVSRYSAGIEDRAAACMAVLRAAVSRYSAGVEDGAAACSRRLGVATAVLRNLGGGKER